MAASRRDDRRRGSGRLRYYRHADCVSKHPNFARVQMHEKCVQGGGRRARLHTFFGTHSKSRNAARAEPCNHTHVSASSIYRYYRLFESDPFYLLGLSLYRHFFYDTHNIL